MEPDTAGDPITGLKWTRKTTQKLSDQLRKVAVEVSPRTVSRLLKKLKFSLRVNRKQISNSKVAPDVRNQQFELIADIRERCRRSRMPIISIDTKKKEKIGRFRNPGTIWCLEGLDAYSVNDHDFLHLASGVFIPYVIYDLLTSVASVFAGTSHDTPAFAVENVARWWRYTGQYCYRHRRRLTILADAGGSNGYRIRAWKYYLQHSLCNCYNLIVTVAHYPPGCSKWNPVERQVNARISKNWEGVPLETYETAMNRIRTTKTKADVAIKPYLINKPYQKGEKISDDEMDGLNIFEGDILPQWHYTIHPS